MGRLPPEIFQFPKWGRRDPPLETYSQCRHRQTPPWWPSLGGEVTEKGHKNGSFSNCASLGCFWHHMLSLDTKGFTTGSWHTTRALQSTRKCAYFHQRTRIYASLNGGRALTRPLSPLEKCRVERRPREGPFRMRAPVTSSRFSNNRAPVECPHVSSCCLCPTALWVPLPRCAARHGERVFSLPSGPAVSWRPPFGSLCVCW